ncbi:AraC family transcriptional regulator [Curtobacterium sp. PhB115]|uniref:AraC family transcriptional regulator n=1 Tax=Curtobacterium sp. PhB115 TaxID=2485173 RepID=UPI000F9DCE5F|nr:AraC family transcriptional regulator [Curtobacterium sp. PhB115]ROP65443.1 AraC-like protein [Curtobacterium sp. PhB115]
MYLPFARREDGRFPGRSVATVESRALGPVSVTKTRAPVSTDPEDFAYVDPGDAVVWAFIVAGRIRVRRSSSETVNSAGTLSVDRMQRIQEFSVSPGFEAVSVRMDRSALHLRGSELDALTDGVFPLTSGVPVMIASVATSVLRSSLGNGRDAASEAAAAQALIALANGFAIDATVRHVPPDAARLALRARALRHIELYSGDPTLTVASLAQAMQVSPRTVQKAFEQDDRGPGRLIAEARLVRAAEMLRDDELTEHMGLEAIGRRAGFGSASAFSRAFRAHHGTTPSEYRERNGAR